MGYLTDFFVATPAEMQSVDIARTPVGSFPGLPAKRTDPVKLVQLQCCIDDTTFEERLPLLDEMLVRDGGTEAELVPYLSEIAQLASQARAEQKALYVWMCL